MLVTKLFSVHRALSLHWGQILFRAHNGSLLISQSNVASSKNKHIVHSTEGIIVIKL